jgi:hypothetical protein
MNKYYKRIKYWINRFWRKIKYIPPEIKEMCRRYKYGYTQVDVWNVYCWFSTVAPKILSDYRKCKRGYPPCFENKGGMEAWEAVLDRMIFCFSEMDEETSSVQEDFKQEYWEERHSGKIEYRNDEEVRKYRTQMKDEGLELFRKYYWDLWD